MVNLIQPVLQIEGLAKRFQVHARGTVIEALRDCSFAVPGGSITALSGPSGAGKSTVLRCIHRSYLPSAGCILLRHGVEELDLAKADDHDVLAARAEHLGYVSQFLHCLPRQGALDVVAGPLLAAGVAKESAHRRAAALLERLDLPRRLWALPPATFSGGERQRVNIARGLSRARRLLLLDEPTASLDPVAAELVLGLIGEARSAGSAIVLICHDPQVVARLADQVVPIAPPAGPATPT